MTLCRLFDSWFQNIVTITSTYLPIDFLLDDSMGLRDAASALEILDLDGDGFIGILDFIYFARRLKKMHQLAEREESI